MIQERQGVKMEKERLKFCIERWDHYYDSVNNKSAVFLGLSTFIVGGLVASYPSVLELVNCNFFIHILMLAAIGIGISIMIIVILASTPFLTKDVDSLLYFGAVSCLSSEDYHKKSVLGCSEELELMDFRNQAHQLSVGLAKKFKKLKLAGMLFAIQFSLFIPLIITIILNLK
jgi:hypothetical protein